MLYEVITKPDAWLVQTEIRGLDLGIVHERVRVSRERDVAGLKDVGPVGRITSYNVCYTKLLRSAYLGLD